MATTVEPAGPGSSSTLFPNRASSPRPRRGFSFTLTCAPPATGPTRLLPSRVIVAVLLEAQQWCFALQNGQLGGKKCSPRPFHVERRAGMIELHPSAKLPPTGDTFHVEHHAQPLNVAPGAQPTPSFKPELGERILLVARFPIGQHIGIRAENETGTEGELLVAAGRSSPVNDVHP